ncbi:MAG: hypothetical protein QNJ29_06400 [Rhizobiaceae bacterium]|nr:hypothetical protein [Rhizobiaceae bacterium]
MHELQSELQTNALLPEKMNLAIAELYDAFQHRKFSDGGPIACTVCCASPEAIERIRRSAPQEISYVDLCEYHNAAKAEGAGQDLAVLLPRTLEFVATGKDLRSAGLFALFSTYFPCMWKELDDHERNSVRQYLHELMLWRLSERPQVNWEYDPIDILEMTASGGLDVDPVIDVLAGPYDTEPAVSLIIDLVLDYSDLWQEGNGLYQVSERLAQHIARRLRNIVTSSNVIALLEYLALEDGDTARAERASLAHQIAENEAKKHTSG